MKYNTKKQADPNSRRSKKRNNRTFKGSRPNRRAEKRLAIAKNGYRDAIKAAHGDSSGYTEPGALKHW